MNKEKLANLIACGVQERDILDIMACSDDEYRTALADPAVQKEIQTAKDKRYQQHNDINDAWDAIEAEGANVVLHTLLNNPDPSFALAAATQANKMRRRDVGTGQIQPINAQQNNIVVLKLNQSFTEHLENRLQSDIEATTEELSSEGMPKDMNSLSLVDAERILLPVETVEAEQSLEDLMQGIKQPVTMDVRR